MSWILNLETATKTCSVSLAKDGVCVDTLEESSDKYIHSEKLTVFIDELLQRNKLTPGDLNAICVSKGPGSYTGLRIGVSCAKGLCYALDIPLLSIDSLEIMKDKFLQENAVAEKARLAPMIDARRMEVYTKRYLANGNAETPIEALILNESTFSEKEGLVYLFGDGADKCKELNFPSNVKISPNFLTSASAMAHRSFDKFKNQDWEDIAYMEPFYLKEFIAGKPKKVL